jgi:hypothetical protein
MIDMQNDSCSCVPAASDTSPVVALKHLPTERGHDSNTLFGCLPGFAWVNGWL